MALVGAGAVKAGEAFVEIGGRDTELAKTLKRSGKRLGDFKLKVQAIGKAFVKLGTIAATAIISIGFVKAIKAASQFEETLSKFNAVFKDLAIVTREWAAAFALDVGRAQDEIVGFLAAMQDTFVPLGFSRDKAAELSKQVTQLALDLASFNNESDAETLRSLQSALIGNTETVRKYGVIITQVTLNQELLNLGIAGGVTQATEQEKVLARLNIILNSTTDAQGDAIRTSGSFANKMKALHAAIRGLLVTVGTEFLPTMTSVVKKIAEATKRFSDWIKETNALKVVFIGLQLTWIRVSGAWDMATEVVAAAFERLRNGIIRISKALLNMGVVAKIIFPSVVKAAQLALATLGEELTNIDLNRRLEEIQKKVDARIKRAKELFRTLGPEAKDIPGELKAASLNKFAEQMEKGFRIASAAARKAAAADLAARQAASGLKAKGAVTPLAEKRTFTAGRPVLTPIDTPAPTSGGFGAFASRLLSRQTPSGFEGVAERQAKAQKETAENTKRAAEHLEFVLQVLRSNSRDNNMSPLLEG